MNVEGLTPILSVTSIEQSFAWFAKVGWEKHWAWGDPPEFAAVRNGKAEIFLCLNGQGAPGTWMTWWVESLAAVDASYQAALKAGLQVPWPPHDMEWNVREFNLVHPDGHTFRVSCGLPETAE